MKRLGYTVTSFLPALPAESGNSQREAGEFSGAGLVALTVTCTDEAVFVDTRSDSPLAASADFTAAITDFRRGFFALFKPLADDAQHRNSHTDLLLSCAI